MTARAERLRTFTSVCAVLRAYKRAGQRPPHDDEVVAAVREDSGVSEAAARDALAAYKRERWDERTHHTEVR